MAHPRPLLDEAETAKFLKVSPRYLQQRRYKGGGPDFIRISHRAIRYDPDAIERWLEERTFSATCEESGTGVGSKQTGRETC